VQLSFTAEKFPKKLARWECTVNEVLVKIRDYAEKRLHPTLQRVYILLEEVKSLASMSVKNFCLILVF
jgi:anaphase-promoting complex subunit 4